MVQAWLEYASCNVTRKLLLGQPVGGRFPHSSQLIHNSSELSVERHLVDFTRRSLNLNSVIKSSNRVTGSKEPKSHKMMPELRDLYTIQMMPQKRDLHTTQMMPKLWVLYTTHSRLVRHNPAAAATHMGTWVKRTLKPEIKTYMYNVTPVCTGLTPLCYDKP